MSEVTVPYDNIYVFHDAENCYLSSKKIEARDSNNNVIKLPNNGGVQFHDIVPGEAIQGAYVFKEVIRTALAFKIGREQAENVEITALDTNIVYHFVISPKAKNTPFYPSEGTFKDLGDIGGGNFHRHAPSDSKVPDGWADQKIKDLWDSQADLCKKNFSPEARKKTLFILISGDRDFATQIRNARKTGYEWATGNWLDIVRESRKRKQFFRPVPPDDSRVPFPSKPVTITEAKLLYDFIVQYAADKAFPESRMLASDTSRFFKNHPEIKHKLADFCNAYPDLFDRYKYENADWIRCIEEKVVPDDGTVGRGEANLLNDFIVHCAVGQGYPESRMLASDTQRFFKNHPEVKHKLPEICKAYPDLFDRYKFEGADWVRCIEKKVAADDSSYLPRPIISTDCTARRSEANLLYDFIVQWANKKASPENRMSAADVQFFFKEYPEVKAKMGSVKISVFCSSYPDLFCQRTEGTTGGSYHDPYITMGSSSGMLRYSPQQQHSLDSGDEKNEIFEYATTYFPPHPPSRKIQIKELVAFYAKKFMSQAMNDSVVSINPVLQVKIASVNDEDKKKWFATIYADDNSAVSVQDFQRAEVTVQQLLDTITIDEPIEFRGIQPELLRDNSELRNLALKEKVFFSITNLSKGLNVSTSSSMLPSTQSNSPDNRSNTIKTDFLRCAETLRHYILSTESDLQPIHMAAYYEQYPEMRAILKNPSFKLKDFCRAFPHLLHMKVDKDKKEWIAGSKYSDDVVHLYSFILEEGETVNGSRRITASKLGTFYKRHPQDENTIKQGKRKPKTFVQQYEDLFKWEDATVEVGFGYIYCTVFSSLCVDSAQIGTPSRVRNSTPSRIRRNPESLTSLDETPSKRNSNPSTSLVNTVSTSIASGSSNAKSTVILVYIGTNVVGKERVRQFMESLCRITEQYSVDDKVHIQMCKTAWPILSATALDVKVGYSSTRDSFRINATGTSDAAKSFIDFMKDRVGTIESCLLKIPANRQKSVGLLEVVQQKSNELLAGEGDKVAAGYTSCYCEVESQKTFKSVVITFLPPWDSNVDANDERQLFDSLVATMKDVIDTYDEAVCPFNKFRRGIDISEEGVKEKFSLYYVNSNQTSRNVLLCGDSQSVEAAIEWLTVVPAAEKEISQIFKVQDGRLVYMLRNGKHAKVLGELKRAVLEGGSRKVVITELVGQSNSYKALFGVKGRTAHVEAAIANGQAFIDRLVATFLDRHLLGPNQADLTVSQIKFLKNEGSYLLKKAAKDFGISLKYDSSNNASKEDNQKEGESKIIFLLFAKIGSVDIRLAHGDMLRVECDAIINPANSRLAHGAGAARAISEAAGPELNAQCEDILKRFGRTIPLSEAVVTDSYDLKRFNQYSKIVVHSVGPKYSTGSSTEIEYYQQTIMNALDKAVENGAMYIAMPLIGSGVFGWPVELAAREMLGAISKWVGAGNSCKRIILVDIEEDRAAAMVQTVQLFNEKVAPLLLSDSKKAATATATVLKVPQFSWYWEVYSHDKDPQGKPSTLFNHPDTIVTAGGAHWVPYDYDQVLQIEAGLADDSFPVILKGDVSGVTNSAFYFIHKGKRPLYQLKGKRLRSNCDSVCEYYQENSETESTRLVLRGEPFDPNKSVMHGYNKGAVVLAKHDGPVVKLGDAAADRFPLVEDVQIVIKKEGFEIFGPKDLVLSAESTIQAALLKEVCAKPFDLQMSAPEDWELVLQRLRTHLLVQKLYATVIDTYNNTRTVIIQAMGSLALAQAEMGVMNFALSISLERSAELSVKWPDEWTGGPFSVNDRTTLVPVDRGTDEWNWAAAEWRKVGQSSRAISAELLKVERVQNVKAWEAYYSRVRLLAGRNNAEVSKGTSVFVKANEKWMKHGTSATSPETIYEAEQGLDCRYCGKGLFGIAAYTAEDALYSDQKYAHQLADGTRQMFLVRVAAGNVHEVTTRTIAHQSLVHPPSGFDSVRGCVLGPDFMAIMVYQPDSAYPAYLLTYQTN